MDTWLQWIRAWFGDVVMPLLERIANMTIPISKTQIIHVYTLEIICIGISLFCIFAYNDDSD